MLFLVVPIVVVVLIVILFSSLYVVRQQSVAIIERFGKYQKLSNSGIHLRLVLTISQRVYNCASCKVRLWLKLRHKTMYLS